MRLPFHASQHDRNNMQNKNFTKVVIWIVVVGMVLSMGVFAVALLT
jgi:hypothetical protein